MSRRATEAAHERLKELAERRLNDRDYLVVYLDGVQFASWVEKDYPTAGSSLRERLGELGLTAPLRRCLGTTNRY